MLCGLAAPALAIGGEDGPPVAALPAASAAAQSDLVDFDIPAQPLADALRRYASQSRQPALYQSGVVAGRTSSAVRGRHTAAAALRLLLEGSGLAAEPAGPGPDAAFVLRAVPAPPMTGRRAWPATPGIPR
ncbi:hypothetical protein [Pigmentiphaga soli]